MSLAPSMAAPSQNSDPAARVPDASAHPLGTLAALVLVMAIGLGLRVYHLGAASLWNDELFSRFYLDAGTDFMWHQGFHVETTPPTYYTLLSAWTELFGRSAAALRWPSVIFSTLTIPLVFLLGREISGRTCGLLAALIFALAPMELYYAQEARAYALLGLAAALALLGGAWFLRTPRATGAAACYLAGIAGAIYVHNTAVFLAAASAVAVGLHLLSDPAYPLAVRLRLFGRFVAINVLALMLCLPELLAMLGMVQTNRMSWMLPTRLWDVKYSLATLIAGPATLLHPVAEAASLMLGAALLVALLRIRPDRRVVTVLIGIPVLAFALLLAASLRQPVLLPRLLVWMWVPLAVLLAHALLARPKPDRATVDQAGKRPTVDQAGKRPTLARAVLGLVTVLVLSVGLGFQLAQDATAKEPWGLMLPRVAPLIASADLVVTGPWTQPMALAYGGVDMAKVRYWSEDMPPTIENTTIRELLGVKPISRADLIAAIRSGQRVLLIQRSKEYDYRQVLAGLPQPRQAIDQRCWMAGDCLGALYWAPDP